MNYIDIFKQIIKEEVIKNNGDKEFIDNLYDNIKSNVIHTGTFLHLPNVDEITLKSYFETAKKEYLSVNPIDPGICHTLTKKGFISWLDGEREKETDWDYSERYFTHLLNSGRSAKVVEETRRSSHSILRKMADPKSKNAIYNKGLVVGAVQSGKTGNFNAVINRAIDSGYVLVIVLSGIMEDLRSQTQKRIESDVIGEGKIDSGEASGAKGVGKIERFGVSGNSKVVQVKTLTSEHKDFSKGVEQLDHTLNDKYVLVCKKNVSVLKNLIIWLHNSLEEGKEKHNIPLLILDDEADNASLNNIGAKGREYASKTNGHIRAILEMFHVKSYLGYTATPFANVLQDRNEYPENDWPIKYKFKGEDVEKQLKRVDNIFPDDFIALLDPPSNYVGAKQIFETVTPIDNETEENDKIPLVAPAVRDYVDYFPSRVYDTPDGETIGVENFPNRIEWDEKNGDNGYLNFDTFKEYRSETRAARKDDDFPKILPDSLKVAVKCFVLSLAIRESRIPIMIKSDLYQEHNTMLVHISRFTFWQNKTKKLIEEYTEEIKSKINNDKPSGPNSIYSELEKIWYSNYGFAHIIENIKSYLPNGYEDEFMTPIVYDSLKPFLIAAVEGIEVKAINSLTKEKLEYPKNTAKKIIAIGGNRLSRGFTLEGLTINYFIRVTNYSDALLQMGRWFGYRPGYLDCCKIFTTQDSLDKFNSTTKCIEELETEFIKMEDKRKDPRSFVLRVKKHPGTLNITRPSILKNAKEVQWSYQDQLEMTTKFKITKDHIEKTWLNFKQNLAPRFDSMKRGLITYSTTGLDVITMLKNQPNNFEGDEGGRDRINQIVKFIELCNEKGLLNDWTIALKVSGNSPTKVNPKEFGLDTNLIPKISLARRSGPSKNHDDKRSFLSNGIFKASGKNANIIANNTDLAILLSDIQLEDAKTNFINSKAKKIQKKYPEKSFEEALLDAEKVNIPERCYREKMSENQGLLVIYLFDSQYVFNQNGGNSKDINLKNEFKNYVDKNEIDLATPLVGYALGFPPMDPDPGGVYMQGDYDLKIDEDIDSEENDELEGIEDNNEI
jgi:hypothetical protein